MFDESTLFNKIVTAAIVGMLGWNIVSVQKLIVDQAVANNNQQVMAKDIADIERSLSIAAGDRYTGKQASSDRALVLQQITTIEGRLAVVEKKVEGLGK